MTSLEFWKITKEYKLPIQKATKGNIMEWVRLEPNLMEDITTLIFAQKTITRSNFFVLEKKWFFDKLQKHKQKFEENLKKESDKIIIAVKRDKKILDKLIKKILKIEKNSEFLLSGYQKNTREKHILTVDHSVLTIIRLIEMRF